MPSYRLAPDYETAVQRKYSQGDYYNQTPNLIPTTSISHQNINLHQVRFYDKMFGHIKLNLPIFFCVGDVQDSPTVFVNTHINLH